MNRSRLWAVGATLVALALIAALVFLYTFRSMRAVPAEVAAGGRAALSELKQLAEAFRQGTVTTSFLSYATEVGGSTYLQVARLRQTEIFERTEQATLLWGQLDLPDVVVRATAPVEYTYYLDLHRRWELLQDGARVRVIAPALEFNPPAVEISKLEYEVRAGSLLGDEEAALERLRHGITQMTRQRAKDNEPLVREIARRQTAEFVRTWIAGRFVDGEKFSVEVVFEDEVDAAELQPPIVEGPPG